MVYPDLHPLKVFEFCPKCGSHLFHPTGDRSKKCSECSFTLYFNSSAAVAALIFDDSGRLLLTRRAVEPFKGKLDLPGGFADPLESAEDAIRRELKEELGIEVIQTEYFCSSPNEYPFSGLAVFTLDLAFKVKVNTLDGLSPMDDICGFGFYELNEIPLEEIPAYSIRNIVERVIRENKLPG